MAAALSAVPLSPAGAGGALPPASFGRLATGVRRRPPPATWPEPRRPRPRRGSPAASALRPSPSSRAWRVPPRARRGQRWRALLPWRPAGRGLIGLSSFAGLGALAVERLLHLGCDPGSCARGIGRGRRRCPGPRGPGLLALEQPAHGRVAGCALQEHHALRRQRAARRGAGPLPPAHSISRRCDGWDGCSSGSGPAQVTEPRSRRSSSVKRWSSVFTLPCSQEAPGVSKRLRRDQVRAMMSSETALPVRSTSSCGRPAPRSQRRPRACAAGPREQQRAGDVAADRLDDVADDLALAAASVKPRTLTTVRAPAPTPRRSRRSAGRRRGPRPAAPGAGPGASTRRGRRCGSRAPIESR